MCEIDPLWANLNTLLHFSKIKNFQGNCKSILANDQENLIIDLLLQEKGIKINIFVSFFRLITSNNI